MNFLLVLPGIHNNIFNKKLQQIRTRIKEVKVDGYSKIRLSVSIGGVMTHNETIESAMHRADKLMLQVKSHQKKRYGCKPKKMSLASLTMNQK